MTDFGWAAYGSIATALSTELNSLASNGKAISAAIDNTTALNIFDDLELVVTFGTGPTAGSVCEVYLIPSVDGTNYTDGDASIDPPVTMLVGTFPMRSVTTAQRVAIRGVTVSPGLWKYLLWNKSGVAFPASGSTVKRRPYKTRGT